MRRRNDTGVDGGAPIFQGIASVVCGKGDRDQRDSRSASSPDRRHDGAPVHRRHPEGLRSAREDLRGLPRSVAGHGDEGGPSPLSTEYGAATDQCRSINAAIAALRFFFNVTLERPDLVRPLTTVNKPRKAPVVLSQDEVARLLEAAPGLKYKAALSVAYGAGLRVSEVAALKVSDIDSQRMNGSTTERTGSSSGPGF